MRQSDMRETERSGTTVESGVNGHGDTPHVSAVAAAPPPTSRPAAASVPAAQHEAGDVPVEGRRRPWIRPLAFLLAAVAFVIAVTLGVRFYRYSATHVSTDDAYLTTDLYQVTPEVGGSVAQVLAAENQPVKRGQLLVVLDDTTYQAAVAQARADLAVARTAAQGATSSVGLTRQTGSAQIEQARGGVQQATSGIASANADVQRAEAGVADASAGVATSFAQLRSAQAAVAAAIAARRHAAASVTSAQQQVDVARATVRSAQAVVSAATATSNRAMRDAQRYGVLYGQNAVSAQQVDEANSAATAAQAGVEQANQQLQGAQATVAQRQADLQASQDAVQSADAALSQAQAQVAAAQAGTGAARAALAQARAQTTAMQQEVAQAAARRVTALGQLGQAETSPRQVAVSQSSRQSALARIQEAEAALQTAQINLRRTRIYAAVDGRVSKKNVDVGQQVAVGQPLMTVVPNGDAWVECNFKETQMQDVRVGEPADIEVDAIPGCTFHGHVQSISAGTGATFAMLPPENATGNFTKVVQRVPVKVTFNPGQPNMDRLDAGLSANVSIETK